MKRRVDEKIDLAENLKDASVIWNDRGNEHNSVYHLLLKSTKSLLTDPRDKGS